MKNLIFYSVIMVSLCLGFVSCISTEKNTVKSEQKFVTEDAKLVKTAILDYVEALYLVDSTRIDKSVDKNLRKIGFWYDSKKKTYVDNIEMTYKQLSSLAAKWNSDYDQANEKSPKEIVIFDINSKTASAKLTAVWGIDLFHLAKVNGQWKIVNIMWQSLPEEE